MYGTGTLVGDSLEVEAIGWFFAKERLANRPLHNHWISRAILSFKRSLTDVLIDQNARCPRDLQKHEARSYDGC
jgi:hypothetical protein